MKQLLQSYKTGKLKLENVPTPALKPDGILVLNRDEFKKETMCKQLYDKCIGFCLRAMCEVVCCSFVSTNKEAEILKKYKPENTWGKIVKLIELCVRVQ